MPFFPGSFSDSYHGGTYGTEDITTLSDRQLFASHGALMFPLEQSDAWTEKVTPRQCSLLLLRFRSFGSNPFFFFFFFADQKNSSAAYCQGICDGCPY